jgi:hypothetical protein
VRDEAAHSAAVDLQLVPAKQYFFLDNSTRRDKEKVI